ncbi:hypothetical protein KUF83_30255 [Streptomyces sp. BV286]|uniref:hypothetical protein n=1 Tax=Streptomyces sp. BV286 TaxID=2849672 RepID=UPI001C2E3EA0|nr:hypothetical protein [Streptomyces sp. BV286]MBV1940819.1 hypothetical protein [Streptomyces sp. BV286]
MSATPRWTDYLTESKVWSVTNSSFELWHAFDEDGRALCNRSIRPRNHHENDAFYRDLRDADRWPLSNVHDRCRTKAEAKVAAHPEAQKRAAEDAAWEAERAETKRQDQYGTAAHLFADVHPAANRVVNSYQENAFTTVWEGGPEFTPAEVWHQIGAQPGADYGQDDDESNDAMPGALLKAWEHLDRRAAAGQLDADRWAELVDEARDVMAYAYEQPGPVVMDKTPESWQVLLHTESPLTGEQWADMPVHSVVRTTQLRAGHAWTVTEQRIAARGLTRYGFPDAVSAGHALWLARKRWETEGPHSAWFEFLANEAPAIEALRGTYAPTPEQERTAFEYVTAAAAMPPAPDLTFADLQAIARGDA